ncbi:MAG: hypothetical protein LBT48_01270 [Prevotellaceae bacterium]|nr:hypothetical protein [Prevotellaceae bacterium]
MRNPTFADGNAFYAAAVIPCLTRNLPKRRTAIVRGWRVKPAMTWATFNLRAF